MLSNIIQKVKLNYFFLVVLVLSLNNISSAQADLSQNELNHLLICYQQTMSKVDGKEKYNLAFKNFPQAEKYKLFIDRDRLMHPKSDEKEAPPHLLFDVHEPGYFKAMSEVFDVILPKLIGKKLDISLIRQLHSAALNDVKSINGKRLDSNEKDGGIYGTIRKFDLEALKELFQARTLFHPSYIASKIRRNNTTSFLDSFVNALFKDQLSELRSSFLAYHTTTDSNNNVGAIHSRSNSLNREQEIEYVLNHYHESIKNSKSLTSKLMAMADLIRTLEIFHIFDDANQRTYVFGALNKSLIENNIPPVILDDPVMFDGYYSIKNISEKIKIGLYNFLNESEHLQRKFLAQSCKKNEPLTDVEKIYLTENFTEYQIYRGHLPKWNQKSFVEVAKNLISKEIDKKITQEPEKINDTIAEHFTLLEIAVLTNDIEQVKKLLENGANPGLTDIQIVHNPIRISIELKNHEITNLLISYLKKEDISEATLRTLVEISVINGSFEDLAKVLRINNGNDLKFEQSLYVLARKSRPAENVLKTIEVLANAGVDPNLNPEDMLEWFFNVFNDQIRNVILNAGLRSDRLLSYGPNIISIAIEKNWIPEIKLFLKNSKFITKKDLDALKNLRDPEINNFLPSLELVDTYPKLHVND